MARPMHERSLKEISVAMVQRKKNMLDRRKTEASRPWEEHLED